MEETQKHCCYYHVPLMEEENEVWRFNIPKNIYMLRQIGFEPWRTGLKFVPLIDAVKNHNRKLCPAGTRGHTFLSSYLSGIEFSGCFCLVSRTSLKSCYYLEPTTSSHIVNTQYFFVVCILKERILLWNIQIFPMLVLFTFLNNIIILYMIVRKKADQGEFRQIQLFYVKIRI